MSTSNDSSLGTKNSHKTSRNPTPDSARQDGSSNMKRAAGQRIQSYFQQLTKGCGVSDCGNEYCASSGKMDHVNGNDAAALALQLFMKKAKLCDALHPQPKNTITTKNCEGKEVQHITEKSLLEIIETCKEEGSFKLLVHTIGEVFSNSESLNGSFLMDSNLLPYGSLTNVDIDSVRRVYSVLFALGDASVENSLLNSLVALATMLEMDLRYKTPVDNLTFLNQFVVLMENTMLQSPEYLEQALPNLCKAMSLLPQKSQAQLVKIWATYSAEEIRRMVETLQQLVTYRVLTGPAASQMPVHDDEAIVSAVKCMRLLFGASVLGGQLDSDVVDSGNGAAAATNGNPEDSLFKELGINPMNCRQPKIKYEEFVNEALNDQIEMDRDFTNYKSENPDKFAFLSHNFILTTATKSLGLFF